MKIFKPFNLALVVSFAIQTSGMLAMEAPKKENLFEKAKKTFLTHKKKCIAGISALGLGAIGVTAYGASKVFAKTPVAQVVMPEQVTQQVKTVQMPTVIEQAAKAVQKNPILTKENVIFGVITLVVISAITIFGGKWAFKKFGINLFNKKNPKKETIKKLGNDTYKLEKIRKADGKVKVLNNTFNGTEDFEITEENKEQEVYVLYEKEVKNNKYIRTKFDKKKKETVLKKDLSDEETVDVEANDVRFVKNIGMNIMIMDI